MLSFLCVALRNTLRWRVLLDLCSSMSKYGRVLFVSHSDVKFIVGSKLFSFVTRFSSFRYLGYISRASSI